jgi:hypothetical protein
VSTDPEEAARRVRAAARRAASIPGEIVRAGSPDPAFHAGVSGEARFVHAWELSRRLWILSRHALRAIPRHELPGEVFDIRAERSRAPG